MQAHLLVQTGGCNDNLQRQTCHWYSLSIIYCTFAPLPNRIPFIAICALLEREKINIRLLGIPYFGKIIKHTSVNSKLDTKGNAVFAYLGKLEKQLLVQHCWAGTTNIYRESFYFGKFLRYHLWWVGRFYWGWEQSGKASLPPCFVSIHYFKA